MASQMACTARKQQNLGQVEQAEMRWYLLIKWWRFATYRRSNDAGRWTAEHRCAQQALCLTE